MSPSKIQATEHPISKVFSNDFVFTIPLYQRPYAWTTDQAGELLDDLMRSLEDDKEDIDQINPYFLGSIVLIKGDKPDAEVVDGQQRLTTFTTILKILNDDFYLMRKTRLYVLLRLDEALSEGTALYNFPHITVEHVLPQNPNPGSVWVNWFPTQEEREKYVHRIGNLVLLSSCINRAAHNYDFELKKQKYFTTKKGVSNFALTTQVLMEKEWTPEVIDKRQEQLIDKLKEIWRLGL